MSELKLDSFTSIASVQSSPGHDLSDIRPEVFDGNTNGSTNDSVPITLDTEAPTDQQDDTNELKVTKKRLIMFSDSDDEPEDNNIDSSGGKTKSPFKSSERSTGDKSSDEDISQKVPKKSRIRKLDSSDSECDNQQSKLTEVVEPNNHGMVKDISNEHLSILKSGVRKHASMSSSSDSSDTDSIPSKYEEQKVRMKEKRNKLQQKFKSLVTSRSKEKEPSDEEVLKNDGSSEGEDKETSDNSIDEAMSIDRIKQKIKERTINLKSTIYDPDTSTDEESNAPKLVHKQKKYQKSTKPTSPKPMRMSAKQAMENMQKIKSESNRMLREKEVSLPYHRPKALSLKDIMSRRRPALGLDGKALPIKMNEEQLKQYAKSLEVRQKEMMELCKSDSDEEPEETTEIYENELEGQGKEDNKIESPSNMQSQNDTLYDTLVQEMSQSILDTSNNGNKITISALKESDDSEIKNRITVDVDMNDKVALKNVKELDETGTNEDNENELLKNDDVTDSDTTVVNTNKAEADVENGTEIEMQLVYKDSIKELDTETDSANVIEADIGKDDKLDTNLKIGTVVDTQLMSLHYAHTETDFKEDNETVQKDFANTENVICEEQTDVIDDGFSDDDINMADIDDLIEKADIISQNNADNYDSPMLIRDPRPKLMPKLTGAPGMIIDLDGTDPTANRKLSGVELLKERFTYFAKLQTPEEMERAREKKLKPGTQHLKLRQELEKEMAEQRSLEWTKRLEEEKKLHQQLNADKGEGSDVEDDIDKIEAKLEEKDVIESSGESEPEVNDCEITDKPVERNPLIADEAEESDCGDDDARPSNEDNAQDDDAGNDQDSEGDYNDGDNEESDDESTDEESEEEQPAKLKKGRILKAFEDSDDDAEEPDVVDKVSIKNYVSPNENLENSFVVENIVNDNDILNPGLKVTQDDDLQLAQEHESQSDDLSASHKSSIGGKKTQLSTSATSLQSDDKDLGTQTFSIIDSVTKQDFRMPDDLAVVCDTQTFSQEGNLDAIVGMCSGSFSQGLTASASQLPSELTVSQIIGDDVLALCTGKFYDNVFVSQQNDDLNKYSELGHSENKIADVSFDDVDKVPTDDGLRNEATLNDSSKTHDQNKSQDIEPLTDLVDTRPIPNSLENDLNMSTKKDHPKDDILESILDELNEPETKKPKNYFVGDINNKENIQDEFNRYKKKFIIDSDDDPDNGDQVTKKRKKAKKKKLQQRALQISDEESDQSGAEEEYESDDDIEDDEERIVEYDSEENEVEVPQNPVKTAKKRKAPDFFEQEAELTSEDEWIGSGDEDEADLDRMEREAGDDDIFNQTKLQRELGQIHMRDVLDQDKREVRIIQELLFEDGDLGTGSRQRKFRWNNDDGVDETGTVVEALQNTQEEEFESEEQWRKQRHEREMFLRDMKQKETEDTFTSVDRTAIIKANLSSKCNSSILEDVNVSVSTEVSAVEKSTANGVPSPKKSAFTLFKQSYHGSLLTRGQGALARLAALAVPLAADEDAPIVGSLASNSKRNFVFATLTQEDKEPKISKRKAEANIGTPRLVKKLKTEDKQKHSKNSLLDHYNRIA